MGKLHKFAMLIIFACLLLAGCTSPTATRKSDGASPDDDYSWNSIMATGTLRVGIAKNLTPFVMQDAAGELCGFDIDLIRALCGRLHITYELITVPEDRALNMLQSKQIDILWNGYTPALERNDQIRWLDPYLCTNQVVVCPKGAGFSSVSQLNDCRLGVVEDTLAEINAKSSKSIDDRQLQRYADDQSAIADLAAHRLDALLIEDAAFYYYTKNNREAFEVLEEILDNDMQSIGVQNGSDALAIQLQNTLKDLKADGTLQALSMEWFNKDLTV